MDNSASKETIVDVKRKAGRPVGAKKRLGMSIEDRLKVLEKIARSTDPEIKEDSKISAIKQITEILADRVDKNERLLPVYRLEFVLDRKTVDNPKESKESQDNKPETASNSPSETKLLPETAPDMPKPIEARITQPIDSIEDIGESMKGEGEDPEADLF